MSLTGRGIIEPLQILFLGGVGGGGGGGGGGGVWDLLWSGWQ